MKSIFALQQNRFMLKHKLSLLLLLCIYLTMLLVYFLFGFSQLFSKWQTCHKPSNFSDLSSPKENYTFSASGVCDSVAWHSLPNTNSIFPSTVDLVPCSSGVPLPGGLGAAVLLLFPEPRSPLLPGRRHRCAVQQRAGEPAAPHLRRQRKESHCDGAQAGVYWGHALPPSQLCRPPGQGM